MTTPDSSNAAADLPAGKPRRRRFAVAASAIAVVATLIAGTALVVAHERGWRHGGSAEEMAEHIERHVKHVLSEVDATQEQKAQITSIMQAAATDVHALHGQHAGAHQQLKEILSAASVDRARLETMRVEHLRLADDASKRLVVALADAADLLTPEQRAALAQKLEKHHRRWQGAED